MATAISGRGDVVARTIARLRADGVDEQLTFAFANVILAGDNVIFECVDERAIVPHEFEHQSWCHLELGDEARAEICAALISDIWRSSSSTRTRSTRRRASPLPTGAGSRSSFRTSGGDCVVPMRRLLLAPPLSTR